MDFVDLIKLVGQAGPYGVAAWFIVIWWLERTERKEIQKEKDIAALKHQAELQLLTDRVTNGLNNSANSMHDLSVVLGGVPRRKEVPRL